MSATIYDRTKLRRLSMPATEQLTITLPSALAQSIRAKVAAGEYASESDYVCESVVMSEAYYC
jgi:hypothetical protein